MADKKLSELTELPESPASGDEVYIRDVSEVAAQESKRITVANLVEAVTGRVLESLFDAHTMLYSVADNTPLALAIAASRIVGRKSTGNIVALTAAEVLAIVNVAAGADVTGSNAPQAHKTSHENAGGDEVSVAALSGLLADDQHVLDAEVTAVAVAKTLFDAQTILTAVSDNTPVALAVAASRILGRKSTGNIAAMTAAEVRTILGVESGSTADQTGAEIVTLLEALVGAAQLSHTKISDVGTTDHHTAAILNSLLTTRGDTIYRGASVPARLAKGSEGDVLTMGANDPAWSAPADGGSDEQALAFALSS